MSCRPTLHGHILHDVNAFLEEWFRLKVDITALQMSNSQVAETETLLKSIESIDADRGSNFWYGLWKYNRPEFEASRFSASSTVKVIKDYEKILRMDPHLRFFPKGLRHESIPRIVKTYLNRDGTLNFGNLSLTYADFCDEKTHIFGVNADMTHSYEVCLMNTASGFVDSLHVREKFIMLPQIRFLMRLAPNLGGFEIWRSGDEIPSILPFDSWCSPLQFDVNVPTVGDDLIFVKLSNKVFTIHTDFKVNIVFTQMKANGDLLDLEDFEILQSFGSWLLARERGVSPGGIDGLYCRIVDEFQKMAPFVAAHGAPGTTRT